MRTEYYDLLRDYSLADVFDTCDYFSYSQKYALIKTLIVTGFSKETINLAISKYKKAYIDNGTRLSFGHARSILIFMCRKIRGVHEGRNED